MISVALLLYPGLGLALSECEQWQSSPELLNSIIYLFLANLVDGHIQWSLETCSSHTSLACCTHTCACHALYHLPGAVCC